MLHDVESGAIFTPPDAIRPNQGHVLILDSMLSENAVLGFEFGFSLAEPHSSSAAPRTVVARLVVSAGRRLPP